MSAPAFFRYLPPMKRKEIAPLVMLFLAAGLIVIFAKVTEELLEGDLHGFDTRRPCQRHETRKPGGSTGTRLPGSCRHRRTGRAGTVTWPCWRLRPG